MVICLEQGADCLRMVWLMPVPSQNPVISCSFKSRMFLPFWFRLTKVVLEKRPLNGCSSSSAAVAVKVKVKFSHTRYRALGPDLIPVYRQSARR